MKMFGFEYWINVIFATLDNGSFHYDRCIYSIDNKQNAYTISFSFIHIFTQKHDNIYTTNRIDILTMPTSWLIGI